MLHRSTVDKKLVQTSEELLIRIIAHAREQLLVTPKARAAVILSANVGRHLLVVIKIPGTSRMDSETTDKPACAEGMTRKEFIKQVLARGAAAGALAVAASTYDMFTPAPHLSVKAQSGPTGPGGA